MAEVAEPVSPAPAAAPGPGPETDIDLDRVLYDPEYRRWVQDHLNRLYHAVRERRGGPSR